MWLLLYSVLGLIFPIFTLPWAKNYELFNQPPTVRLTAQNFAKEVNSSPNPWLIVIYSESSQTCKRYSNLEWSMLIKFFGREKFRKRFPIFGENRVGAIEKSEGLFATDEHDFPIIKIFPPNSSGVPLSKKIDPYNIDTIIKILTIIRIGQQQVGLVNLPKTSQEWTTRIDKILASDAAKEEWVRVETYTEVIRTATTTRGENPSSILRVFFGLILLLLLCCKWIVKCCETLFPEGNEVPDTGFHRDPGYSYDHPQPRAWSRSEAIPLPPP